MVINFLCGQTAKTPCLTEPRGLEGWVFLEEFEAHSAVVVRAFPEACEIVDSVHAAIGTQ